MNRIPLELNESELKIVANALQYAKSYKGIPVYGVVLKNIVDQLNTGVPKYFVVQGIFDDGISRCSKAVLIKAKSKDHAVRIARARLESDAGESFTVTAVGEATKDYALCEVL